MQEPVTINKLFIASRTDPSGSAIYEYMKQAFSWDENDGVLINGNMALCIMDKPLLYENYPERIFKDKYHIENIIFLSKHSSVKEISSLTVHPLGNFSTADLGGNPGTFSMSSPGMMTSALRLVREKYKGDRFMITLEATHHGPLTDIPSFFAEIGTTSHDWSDPEALNALSSAVMETAENNFPDYIGIGGGHYTPKITNYALQKNINVGHIISKHRHNELTMDMIYEAIRKTPVIKGFIIDKKGSKASALNLVRTISEKEGFENIIL